MAKDEVICVEETIRIIFFASEWKHGEVDLSYLCLPEMFSLGVVLHDLGKY